MEKVKGKLLGAIENVKIQKTAVEAELAKLEEDFANVKLNPYGITSIDFSKRQELSQDVLKMEGTMMGIQLAVDLLEEQGQNDGSSE